MDTTDQTTPWASEATPPATWQDAQRPKVTAAKAYAQMIASAGNLGDRGSVRPQSWSGRSVMDAYNSPDRQPRPRT